MDIIISKLTSINLFNKHPKWNLQKIIFLNFSKALKAIDLNNFNKAVKLIANKRKVRGRLFILGVGGSAGNSSHAVNDFRKLCNIEAYSPTDNVSEITARTNDEGFHTIFSEYLKISNIGSKDILLIFSVGGGNLKKRFHWD